MCRLIINISVYIQQQLESELVENLLLYNLTKELTQAMIPIGSVKLDYVKILKNVKIYCFVNSWKEELYLPNCSRSQMINAITKTKRV